MNEEIALEPTGLVEVSWPLESAMSLWRKSFFSPAVLQSRRAERPALGGGYLRGHSAGTPQLLALGHGTQPG